MKVRDSIELVWNYYDNIIQIEQQTHEQQINSLSFSIVPQSLLEALLSEVSRIMFNEPPVLRISGDVVVVGEIHGHILDLFRIIRRFGDPRETKYLFIGDIVDRGEFSTEVAILVFVMKYLWPENIFIIRGNHEFTQMSQRCGQFSSELIAMYGNKNVESYFQHAFAFMPLAAVVNDNFFCVHGGIGPNSKEISMIEKIRRPFYDCGKTIENALAEELFWSEPSKNCPGFRLTKKKHGYLFGSKVIKDFLDHENLKLLVRSREGIEQGIEYVLDDSVVSICSASNFCGISPNKSGVLLLREDGKAESIVFPPIPYIKRSTAVHLSKQMAKMSPTQQSPLNLDTPFASSLRPARLPILLPRDMGLIQDNDANLKTNRRVKMSRKVSDISRNARAIRKEVLRAEELTGMRKTRIYVRKRSKSVY